MMEKKAYIIGGVLLALLLVVAVLMAYGFEAQKRTDERINELAEAQKRTEERINKLAEAGLTPCCVQLTAADNGSEIELKKGQALIINLEANPTTGYTWDVVEPRDKQVLRQVGEIEFKPESDLIGAGGVQIIRFEVVNAGRAALKLIYHRPWETDVEPLKTFAIQVLAR